MRYPFMWGVVVGVGGMWAFHKYVRPVKTNVGG